MKGAYLDSDAAEMDMHGLINRAIERFARDTYGRDVWGTVMRRAGLDTSNSHLC